MIKTKKWTMQGNGSIEPTNIVIDENKISTAIECGYEHRPFQGLTKIKMENGEEFFCSLTLEEISK